MESILIPVPREFNYQYCLQFLTRNSKEILHRVDSDEVRKLIQVSDQSILVSVRPVDGALNLSFPAGIPSPDSVSTIVLYVREWFDLDTDLRPFYRIAKRDVLLGPLAKRFRGHRIMSHPDLFESLIWAVLGQQINLQFAYTLKQRFVDKFGSRVMVDNQTYYLFPTPARVATLNDTDLLPLQFSRQKSAYAINIAKAFVSGEISKEKLKGLPLETAKEHLMRIKGVGNWTANYALLRTFRYPDAFPLEDAGLHNALRGLLKLREKPSLKRVKNIFKNYRGWEAYATVYFWKSL